MPADGSCEPIPAHVPIPDGFRAVRCQRRMIVADDVWYDLPARRALLVEHHAWLCPNPTPGVAAARRRAQGPTWP
jgi:hypothetical protein